MGNIIFGIIAIIAGISGKFVLLGTESSLGLSAIGVFFVVLGIIRVMNDSPEADRPR